MKYTLVLTRTLLDQALQAIALDPGAVLVRHAGRRSTTDAVEFIAPRSGEPSRLGTPVVLHGIHERMQGMTSLYLQTLPRRRAPRPRVEVALYPGRGASAFLFVGDDIHDLDCILIRGARMERWVPSEPPQDLVGAVPRDGRFSRYIGALGGEAVHERLRDLRVAICGVSRTGSMVATHLVRAGVRKLTLIDPDVVEDHLLDAMDVRCTGQRGRTKVASVAIELRRIDRSAEILALANRLEDAVATSAALEADVLVTTADSHRPRVFAASLSAAFAKVHVDVGTGVLRANGRVEMGLDVRLMTPGACILCNGGVAIPRQDPSEDWRDAREGSLRSLNGVGSSLAMLLVEQLVRGELTESAWWTLRFDSSAEERFVRHAIRSRSECPVCLKAGWGDVAWTRRVVSAARV